MMPPFMFLVPLVLPAGALVFFGWLALRFVRAKERERLPTGEAASPAQLQRIEEQLDTLQSQFQQLQERQTFVEKLLERPREPR